MPLAYSAVKNSIRLFKLKTNRLKGRFVFSLGRKGFQTTLVDAGGCLRSKDFFFFLAVFQMFFIG